jgi:hypothetical protein
MKEYPFTFEVALAVSCDVYGLAPKREQVITGPPPVVEVPSVHIAEPPVKHGMFALTIQTAGFPVLFISAQVFPPIIID